jgi:hypothetical protein
MKRILLVLPLILLSACAAVPVDTTPLPVEPELTAIPSNTQVILTPTAEMPSGKLPAAPFEAQTYIDEKNGFAFDYPNGWTVSEPMGGERGSQVQFLSSPDLANMATLPEGATRLSATVYDWDPKNDLTAYVAHWKSIWSDPGFKVLEEEQLVLEQGLPAVQFTVQSSNETTVFLITALKDRYLVLSGEGDLELVKEIVGRLRPIS